MLNTKKNLLRAKKELNKNIKLLYAKLDDFENNITNVDRVKYFAVCSCRENRYQRVLFDIENFVRNQYICETIEDEVFVKTILYLDMIYLIEKKEVDNKLLNLKLEEKKKCQNH